MVCHPLGSGGVRAPAGGSFSTVGVLPALSGACWGSSGGRASAACEVLGVGAVAVEKRSARLGAAAGVRCGCEGACCSLVGLPSSGLCVAFSVWFCPLWPVGAPSSGVLKSSAMEARAGVARLDPAGVSGGIAGAAGAAGVLCAGLLLPGVSCQGVGALGKGAAVGAVRAPGVMACGAPAQMSCASGRESTGAVVAGSVRGGSAGRNTGGVGSASWGSRAGAGAGVGALAESWGRGWRSRSSMLSSSELLPGIPGSGVL